MSGDDLEDDFLTEEAHTGIKGSISDSKDANVKPKKKQGTKVVNFVG